MSPSFTVHGGQHDTKYVTFELLLHAAFVADEIWGFMLEPARSIHEKKSSFARPCIDMVPPQMVCTHGIMLQCRAVNPHNYVSETPADKQTGL